MTAKLKLLCALAALAVASQAVAQGRSDLFRFGAD